MTLNELYKEKFNKVKYIAICGNKNEKIYADFADEYLETHGNFIVKEWHYVESKDVLAVWLEE